jgi:PfaD family protein
VRVGAGGGVGNPAAVSAAFAMGAAFVLTGTINQMSRQADTCDFVRKQLSMATYSDVTMAPAADMFDEGVQLQVLKKGTMFPARAKKLYELYHRYKSLDALPPKELKNLETRIFSQTVAQVWDETVNFYVNRLHDEPKVRRAEQDPQLKMSMCFRWYLSKSSGWANRGESKRKLDYQVWCGPAIGSFNAFIKDSVLDPCLANAYPCVFQINAHLLQGACYDSSRSRVIERVKDLRQALPSKSSDLTSQLRQFEALTCDGYRPASQL